MKALLINASPKRITCASKYFLDLLNIQMAGCDTEQIKLTGPAVYNNIFSRFDSIDALVIALPVYIDGVPSSVLRFMQKAEEYIKRNNCRFKLYVVSNCGFIEGRQCKNVLSIMRSFSDTAGLEWGGGVGIGGGEMLSVLRLTPLFELTRLLLTALLCLFKGDFIGGFASYPWIGFIINMLRLYGIDRKNVFPQGAVSDNFAAIMLIFTLNTHQFCCKLGVDLRHNRSHRQAIFGHAALGGKKYAEGRT